jgi:putative methionine-R-sulfoxide reductase with GAF domain
VNLLQKIVRKIAGREGVDPKELEIPLNDVVDPDALEDFITDAETQQGGPYPFVEFEYYGYTVTIDGTENVTIGEHASTRDEFSKETSEKSLDSLSAEIDQRKRAMRDAIDTISARERPFVERLNGLLESVRKSLEMESGTLSYVDKGSYVFEAVDVISPGEIQAGEIVPLGDTVCKRVIETERPLVLRDVAVDAPELAHSACEASSYIRVPVFVDSEVYGTFCFHDKEPRDEKFSDWDLAFVELLGNWVSSELERRRRERALHAATTERPYGVN